MLYTCHEAHHLGSVTSSTAFRQHQQLRRTNDTDTVQRDSILNCCTVCLEVSSKVPQMTDCIATFRCHLFIPLSSRITLGREGFPLYCLQRILGLSRNPKTFFQDSVVAQRIRGSAIMRCINLLLTITLTLTLTLNYNKQQLLTLYTQCDSTIHCKTFITSCKETVRLAHSRNTSYNLIYLHIVFYR